MFTKFILSVLGPVVIAKTTDGKCPDVEFVAPLDESKFVGTWYELYRDIDAISEKGAKCV